MAKSHREAIEPGRTVNKNKFMSFLSAKKHNYTCHTSVQGFFSTDEVSLKFSKCANEKILNIYCNVGTSFKIGK